MHITDLAAWCNISFSSSSSNPLSYANHLFLNGEEVKDLVIPESVTSIGGCAFSGCSGLTSVSIPESVTSIGSSAFSGCSGLTSLTIPNSVTSIGGYAFSGCSGLTSVHITDLAAWCNISFGDNPLSYAHHLFLNGEEVTDLTIPESVTSIGSSAFWGCSGLTSLTIPNSVTSIGNYAFGGCSGLTSVKVNWNRPLAGGADSFEKEVKQNATLYVPKGTAMMYMSASGWSEFVNIQEFEDGEDVHYITIRMGDGGVLKQSVEVGNTYTYPVSADEGWEVSTLTFDGKDMTSLLMDGQFSTPVITGNSELNVVFREKGSSVEERPEAPKVKVYASNKAITVAGADDHAAVNVYSTNGILVKSSFGNVTLPLNDGVYIVKVGKETFKVCL